MTMPSWEDDGRVFASKVRVIIDAGPDQGTIAKYYDEAWRPADGSLPPPPSERRLQAYRKYDQGLPLERRELPEALCVQDAKRFARTAELFKIGSYYAVRGKLAEVLSEADLGEGGLVPIPVYEADRTTEREGPFYVLNWGARKNTLIGGESRSVELQGTGKSGMKYWSLKFGHKDGDLAVKASCRGGADLWFDPKLYTDFFMSGRLVEAIRRAKVKVDFDLSECRVIEGE